MVEMKEIKPKMSDRIKGFFIMHPLFFAWVIIIAIIMLNSCGKAKAADADYTETFWADVQEEMTNIYTGSYTVSGMQTALANDANSLSLRTSVSHYIKFPARNGNGVVYMATGYPNALFIQSHGINGSNDSTGGQLNFNNYWSYFGRGTSTYTDSLQSVFFVYVQDTRCGIFRAYNKGTSVVNAWYPYAPYNEGTLTQFYWGSDASLSLLYGNSLRDVGTGNFDFIYEGYKSYGENNYYGDYEGRLLYFPPDPTYVDDNRLVLYTTYSQNGSDLLTTDITKFVEDFPIQDTSHSSVELVTGSLSLTVDSDGQEQVYVLSDVNSTFTSEKYRVITPYDVFDLSGDDVKITKVTFALSGSGQGIEPYSETYYIECEYWLKHTHDEVEQNDNPYADDVDGSVLTNSEKQALQYLVDFDHGAGLTFSQYQGLDKPDFFEDDAVFVYLSDGGTLQDLLEDIAQIPLLGQYADMIASFINNIDDTVELQAAIYDYLYDNAYTQTSSMIVFVYIDSWTDWTAGTFSTDDLTYYYYITTYGRIRQLNQTLADIYIADKQVEANTAAIFDEIDGFEDSFIDFYNMTIADNATARGWLSTINNSINSLDFPVFDDTDIINKLNEIKTAITNNSGSSAEDEDDTIEEAIKYYTTHSIQEAAFEDKFSVWFTGKAHYWLQSKKEDGEPNDPTSNRYYILTGMWDAVCNAYDYLTDESQFWYSFNAYLESLTGTYNTSGTTHTEALDEKHQYMTFFNNGFYDVNEYDGQLTVGE